MLTTDPAAFRPPQKIPRRPVQNAEEPRSAAGAGMLWRDEPFADALASVLGWILGLIQQRSRATRLSEDFASASQNLAETQESIAEAKTLSAIGEMASGAAHELNNPLAIVSGRAQLMARKATTEQERSTWKLIAEQAHRISDIVSEMMELACPPSPQPGQVDVAELLRGAAEAFSASDHPKSLAAQVDISISEGVSAVLVDVHQLREVIGELITNAATAAGASPSIVLSAVPGNTPGTVLLKVTDDGPGMDAKTLANAFMPFFSSQQAGRRRGMGLPRARRYIENTGGKLWIRSAPGQGTTAYVQLKAAAPGDAKEAENGTA